jgi:hypothetical protein
MPRHPLPASRLSVRKAPLRPAAQLRSRFQEAVPSPSRRNAQGDCLARTVRRRGVCTAVATQAPRHRDQKAQGARLRGVAGQHGMPRDRAMRRFVASAPIRSGAAAVTPRTRRGRQRPPPPVPTRKRLPLPCVPSCLAKTGDPWDRKLGWRGRGRITPDYGSRSIVAGSFRAGPP